MPSVIMIGSPYSMVCHLTAKLTDTRPDSERAADPDGEGTGVFLFPLHQGKSHGSTFSFTYDVYQAGSGPELFRASEAYRVKWAKTRSNCEFRNLTEYSRLETMEEAERFDAYLSDPEGAELRRKIGKLFCADPQEMEAFGVLRRDLLPTITPQATVDPVTQATPSKGFSLRKLVSLMHKSEQELIKGTVNASLPDGSVSVQWRGKDVSAGRTRPQIEFIFDKKPFCKDVLQGIGGWDQE